MDRLDAWSLKPKKMDLEEDFYFDYGAEEITDYRDPSELVAALKQKEEEVILAAQLGNALLLENRQLKEQSEKLHEQYEDKLEVRPDPPAFIHRDEKDIVVLSFFYHYYLMEAMQGNRRFKKVWATWLLLSGRNGMKDLARLSKNIKCRKKKTGYSIFISGFSLKRGIMNYTDRK